MSIDEGKYFEFDDSRQAFDSLYDTMVKAGFTGGSSRPDTYQFTRYPGESIDIVLLPNGEITVHVHDEYPPDEDGLTLQDEVDEILDRTRFRFDWDDDEPEDSDDLGEMKGFLGGKLLAVVMEVFRRF